MNNSKHVKSVKIGLIFLCLIIIGFHGVNCVNAATPNKVTYVTTTGSDITGNGTINNPYHTIGKGVNSTKASGTLHIANGIYKGTGNKNITITQNINIIGASQDKTVINGDKSYVFKIMINAKVNIKYLKFINCNDSAIKNGGILTVQNSTFENNTEGTEGGYGDGIYNIGVLTVINSKFNNNSAGPNGGAGGAIYNDEGTLTVENSSFTKNCKESGGAIYNNHGNSTINNCIFNHNLGNNAAAIYNGGTMKVINSKFNDNGVDDVGGAIGNDGTLKICNCTFSNNISYYLGGAIYNDGTLIVNKSKFNGNSVKWDHNDASGGAILNNHGNLTVYNSTFSHNTATGNGGAIFNNNGNLKMDNDKFDGNIAKWNHGGGCGGSICNNNGNLTAYNSTFSNNKATSNGGAIYNNYGTLNINKSVFRNNSAKENGGAIYIQCDKSKVAGCVIVGNKAIDVYLNDGNITADGNWWGTNFNGTNPQKAKRTNFKVNNWIVLQITTYKTSIPSKNNMKITAYLQLYDPSSKSYTGVTNFLPLKTVFTTDKGVIVPNETTMINGVAITTYTATETGLAIINATIDQQTVSTKIKITPNNSKDDNSQNNNYITMQSTGVPLVGLIIAVLTIVTGIVTSKKK